MKVVQTIIFVFFSIFCLGQRAPKKDSVVTYFTCNNNTTTKVTLLYYKGEISFVSKYDSLTKKDSWIKNPKNTFKPSFKCGPISCVELYKSSSQKKMEYERDAQGIIWRKKYSLDGTLTEDYKR